MAKKITLQDYTLPTVADGLDGLLQFAEIFGGPEALAFLSMGYRPGSQLGPARQILAARLVADYMRRHPGDTYREARTAVSREQGYTGILKSNFSRLSDPGRELLRQRGEWPFDPSRDV